MKIRTDFVTNSSSSSFIVAFNKLPTSVEEMKELLFGDGESFSNPYDRVGYPAMEVATTVFNDAKPVNEDDLEDFWYGDASMVRDFIKTHKGKVVCVFTYADEDGSYFSALEHGDLFAPLEHVRISNH